MVGESCSPFGAQTFPEVSSPTPTSVIAATDHTDDLHSLSRGSCGCRPDNPQSPPRARCHVDPHCHRAHGEEWDRRAGEGSQLATETECAVMAGGSHARRRRRPVPRPMICILRSVPPKRFRRQSPGASKACNHQWEIGYQCGRGAPLHAPSTEAIHSFTDEEHAAGPMICIPTDEQHSPHR